MDHSSSLPVYTRGSEIEPCVGPYRLQTFKGLS